MYIYSLGWWTTDVISTVISTTAGVGSTACHHHYHSAIIITASYPYFDATAPRVSLVVATCPGLQDERRTWHNERRGRQEESKKDNTYEHLLIFTEI